MARPKKAPEALRSGLFTLLDDRGQHSDGEFDPHETVRRLLGKASNAWGPSERLQEVKDWVYALDLDESQRLLDEVEPKKGEVERLNKLLARSGDGIEVTHDGQLVNTDYVSEVVGVLHLEQQATSVMTGPFSQALVQYKLALDFLNAQPINQPKAVSEAVGALEAVVRIASNGGKDFGPNVKSLFAGQEAWTRLLGTLISQLQGYRSQVPGAGHGRYADPRITDAEVAFIVRACGSAITWIISDHDAGRLP